jgi:5'-methylthioadenosine phosphorylase
VPYRANIAALKSLGCKFIVSVSACGSLREDVAPGNILVPDQLFDHTKGLRDHTFFGNGVVGHVTVADPFSPELSAAVASSVRAAGGTVHEGGTFITIEGPRFSTRSESHLYRSWGMSIIGMTTSPEAFLAAEAEIAYAVMAHITDFDVWHVEEEAVTVETVTRMLLANTRLVQDAIRNLVTHYGEWAGEWPVHNNLQEALITDRGAIPAASREKLDLLLGRYLD